MNKIKDFFYNINDIVVALAILAAAAFIIFTRVELIMDYPAYMAAKHAEEEAKGVTVDFTGVDLTQGEVDENLNSNPESLEAGSEAEGTSQEGTEPSGSESTTGSDPAAQTPSATGEIVTIVIPAGSSGSKIADIIVEAGLIDSKQTFLSTLTQMKKDTKLQTGTFKIPMGSTPEEIVKLITR